ncbi:monooxygenase [Aspergillus foveolatus]|uniref:monooxygenase n=1 Tax=Aspergillus foveolatus TaxID=210207 RepID=UPI003CCDCE4B
MTDQHPLPVLTASSIDPGSIDGEEVIAYACGVLNRLNAALAASDAEALESCFYADQSYWKDQLTLTWHLRTFRYPGAIAASFLDTARLRDFSSRIAIDGEAVFLTATPALQFIDCPLVFKTESPAGLCRVKMLLLLVIDDGADIIWKIWILSTRLESLDLQAEDEHHLRAPARPLRDSMNFETDVFIIGAGNAAIALSARLKALGVESVMADRALVLATIGHFDMTVCASIFQLHSVIFPINLASQVRRYVDSFNLNTLHSAEIQWTEYDELAKKWTIAFQTPAGQRKAISSHLVLATGIGSQKPNMPYIAEPHIYKGISIHSAEYKNAKLLKEQGVKSVVIIGSANTAFDVLEDCHSAALDVTMVARSPTYIVPLEYVCPKASLGTNDTGVYAADNLFLSLPTIVDGQLGRELFSALASAEPERYAALNAAGFPVLDSREPTCTSINNLLERAGAHYIDFGGTKLIEEGKVSFKAGAEPVSYRETGLQFLDSTCLDTDADAVIWCTGFADSNVVTTSTETLGSKSDVAVANTKIDYQTGSAHVLTAGDIASRLDVTWGVDEEGEIRGMWKRHSHAESIWIMGGYTQQHRWYSAILALQIKKQPSKLLANPVRAEIYLNIL